MSHHEDFVAHPCLVGGAAQPGVAEVLPCQVSRGASASYSRERSWQRSWAALRALMLTRV